jgi:DNA adenine methylase
MISISEGKKTRRIPNLVKWAGGKGYAIENLMNYVPAYIDTYHEPFFGGGSLFWNLKQGGVIDGAIISDVNPHLINLLNVVKSQSIDLAEELTTYVGIGREDQYYEIRERFNLKRSKKNLDVEKAAMFLYLNRNCYNGLWRINRKGEFNVPFGFYKKYYLPSLDNLKTYSELLQNTAILLDDFSVSMKLCKESDFVYLDPPYYSTSGFTEYAGVKFTLKDQAKLASLFRNLSEKGVFLTESNSNHPEILSLYHGFNLIQINGQSLISSKNDGRGITNEVIITN